MSGITTTDLLGSMGKTGDDCRSTFGGTSAAAPMAAGAVAVLLQAYPELNWREVQDIIVHSSKMIGVANWVQNGAGLFVSHEFGYGLIDVDNMITYAAKMTRMNINLCYLYLAIGPNGHYDSGIMTVNMPIPDNDPTGITLEHKITGIDMIIEHVDVYVTVCNQQCQHYCR